MSNSTLFAITSNPLTQFTEALAAAAVAGTPPFVGSALYNLPGVPNKGGGRFLIRAVRLITVENFGPEVNFFSSGIAQPGATPLLDAFEAKVQFFGVQGEQIGGAGLFRYYIDGLAIPFGDADSINNTTVIPALHVILQNIDVIAKQVVVGAALPGQAKLTVWIEPRQAW